MNHGSVQSTSVYVTDTDTGAGAGKMLASASLLHALRAVGMKPVASGCHRTANGWRNDDALLLRAASDPVPADINPGMDRPDDNFALLQKRLDAPCWGRLPFRVPADPAGLAAALQLPGGPTGGDLPRTSGTGTSHAQRR